LNIVCSFIKSKGPNSTSYLVATFGFVSPVWQKSASCLAGRPSNLWYTYTWWRCATLRRTAAECKRRWHDHQRRTKEKLAGNLKVVLRLEEDQTSQR
ncbi:hypothetical protein NDU88_013034, partial [Pleurodeles waltl]